MRSAIAQLTVLMIHYRALFVLLPGLLITGTARAQAGSDAGTLSPLPSSSTTLGPVEIESIDVPAGRNIVQDHRGFLWIAGMAGLYRYDGLDYTLYQHERQDPTSLSSSRLEDLYIDSDGTLWISAYGGLNRYDEATDTFTRFLNDPDDPTSLSQDSVTAVLRDSQGTLWVGTHKGLNRFDPFDELRAGSSTSSGQAQETGGFIHYRHDPNDPTSLSNDQIRVLYEDRQGTVWIGTGSPTLTETPAGEGGLNRFDPETETFIRYMHDPKDETSLIDNKIMSLYEDSKGVFWVGTLGDGLHTMDRKTGKFTRHRYDPDDPTKLSRPFLEGTRFDDSCTSWDCGGVSFIYEDRLGMLWIGALYGGVNRYDRSASQAGSVEVGAMTHHEAGPGSLGDNLIMTISESNDGTLWVGTLLRTYKVVYSALAFSHVAHNPADSSSLGGYKVSSLYEDREGVLWVSTWQNGMDRLDASTGVPGSSPGQGFTHFRHTPDDPGSLGSNGTRDLFEDSHGDFWVVTWGSGLDRFDRSMERSTRFRSNPDHPTGLGNAIRIHEDRRDRFWVGTFGNGLDRFDPVTSEAVHHRHDPDDPESLSNDYIHSILEDGAGTLWIGTQSGLNRLIEGSAGANFASYLLDKSISTLYEDGAGRLWVGTWGDGLYLFDRENESHIRYGPGDGLPSTNVAGLIEDDDGYLWISTAEGDILFATIGRLSRLDPESETFTNFDGLNGLPEIGFVYNNALKTRDGRLLFGGNGGFTAFDPRTFREPSNRHPQMTLTALHVFSDEVVPGPEAPLTRPIHEAEEILLTDAQNNFSIDYTAFSFRDAERTQYQYQLEDYDTGWVNARTSRSARYANLLPGTYTFRVRATDSRGVQSEEASIRVVMLPPWWRTTWMFVVYGLLFAVGVFGVDRFQRKRLIAKEREKTRERELTQAREIEKAYTQLKTTQAQLIQQEKMASLGQLTAGIAHEIKNPLNFVNNFAGLIGDLLSDLRSSLDSKNEEAGEIIDILEINASKIHEHGRRADRIVESMMRHASGATGERQKVDLNALVEEYVNLALHSWHSRRETRRVYVQNLSQPSNTRDTSGLNVVRDYDEQAGKVELVPQEIGQVLVNLFNNAFDTMMEQQAKLDGEYQARLVVSTKRVESAVEIRVADNGAGIPRQARDRIFEPFFTTKPTGSGTGLGLSLSYDIVTQGHGGRLSVETDEGSGATFVINLPVEG